MQYLNNLKLIKNNNKEKYLINIYYINDLLFLPKRILKRKRLRG